MNRHRREKKRGIWLPSVIASVALLAAVLAGNAVGAMHRSMPRTYIFGMDPLCDITDLPPELACPAVTRADNGDTIWIGGMGTFDPRTRSASGGGSFTHKDPDGNVVGAGTWEALGLLSFHSYGTAQLGDLTIEGGLALLRVRLTSSGVEFQGILQIDCLVGKAPAGAIEGIRLAIQETDLNFNKEISGLTVFLP